MSMPVSAVGGPAPPKPPEQPLVLSYLTLRRAIGLLGMSLPVAVALGARILFHTGIQNSISGYYYTGSRDIFVGTLCAIGVFLLSYRGYERSDDLAGDLACVFAVGVALFPTAPGDPAMDGASLIGYMHLAFASLFFLTLTYFSLVLFTKTDPTKRPTRRKLQRNKVYKTCGYTMLACLALILMFYLLPQGTAMTLAGFHPLFWLEAIAIEAFGISWLTKGEAILKDEV
jgi:hypothetical protein